MAKGPPPTVGDLRRKGAITDEEIFAAVDSYLINPHTKPFGFASGHVLDVAAAIEAHRPAKAALNDQSMNDTYRYMMIRTAVILAVPSVK